MLDIDLQSGKMLAVQGDKATVSTILISMAVKLQKRSKVLYIDSANTFNPLFIRDNYYQPRGMNLRKIMIARPFTASQIAAVFSKLDTMILETRAKSIVVSSLDSLFQDSDLSNQEVLSSFSQAVDSLLRVSRRHNVLVIVGISNLLDSDRSSMIGSALKNAVDVCCKV